jgi:hypothetical protein
MMKQHTFIAHHRTAHAAPSRRSATQRPPAHTSESVVLRDYQRLGPNLASGGIRAVPATAGAATPTTASASIGGRGRGGSAHGRQEQKARLARQQTAVDDGVGLGAGEEGGEGSAGEAGEGG